MTAAATRPPFADASPAQTGLVPEEQPRFDHEYRRALDMAAETFSLDQLDATLTAWRRIAWLCTDPDRYRQMWRRAATTATGQALPDDEELSAPQARLGY